EPRAPYERPPLSKGFLTGGGGPAFLRPLEQYAEAGVELRLGVQVVELDTDHRLVRLAGGDSLEYDLALLATGVGARRLPDVEGALYLRRWEDAVALREALAGPRLTVLGAGFIGCEVAASARAVGCSVTLYEALEAPLLRVLGRRLGDWLAGVHRSHGVELRLGASEVPGERPLLVAAGTQPRGRRHVVVDQ